MDIVKGFGLFRSIFLQDFVQMKKVRINNRSICYTNLIQIKNNN